MAVPDNDVISRLLRSAAEAASTFEREASRAISDAVNEVLNGSGGSHGRPGSSGASYRRPGSASSADIRLKQQQKAMQNQNGTGNNSGYRKVNNPQSQDYARHNMGVKSAYNYAKWQPPQLYKNTSGETTGGVMKAILGYGVAIAGAAVLISTIVSGGGVLASLGGLLGGSVMVAAGLPIGVSGSKQVSRVKRFKEYVKALGGKTVEYLKNLAKATGRSVEYLQSDLQDLSDRRYFTQGHFDEEREQFMTSDETYQKYLALLDDKKKAEEVSKQADDLLRESGLTPAGIEIVKAGQEYLTKIQRMNAELPGEEITEKLQALERVIARILSEVRNQPSKATELRRMMNYYLPTTWNLLQTYKQIEDEKVKTAQMVQTQLEIEKSIDTVNAAFENLLDRLFRDRSWDVSADISVLNSMLKQDSLKDDNIKEYANKEGEGS
ncbi:MAG: 5-bromo-4-chloroindolyl phosphate hydrolysis family protein [Lachnospiraceae bacterium]|nr:5-bromo-4-chloroindolyl phosphate hydrolysis family protein [Lachnospiraceae bacterium]